jgi:hypothetical protein
MTAPAPSALPPDGHNHHNASCALCGSRLRLIDVYDRRITQLESLAAPLAPEIVAVLRAAEVMSNSGYNPEYFDAQDDAVDTWIAAGRPGLPAKTGKEK